MSSGTSAAAPTTAVATTNVATTATTLAAPFSIGKTLRLGHRGPLVLQLEQRLDSLRYDTGAVDGRFDIQTWEGVIAFQKVSDLKRTGTFDAATQRALHAASVPDGLLPNGGLPRVEVDLSRQVLMYFDELGLRRVAAISSGSGKQYCEVSKKSQQKVCGSARTPRGNFRIQRRIKGDRESDLGHLYNPVYFSGGFAVHGSPSVPGHPASHGCVRVTNKTADWFFDTVKNGTPIYLYD